MPNARRWALTIILAAASLPARAQGGQSDEELRERATDFVALLAKEQYEAAFERFDAAMKKAMPAAQLRAAWKSVAASAGPLEKALDVRVQASGPYRAAIVACRFAKALVDVRVVYDAQGAVTGLFFAPNTTHVQFRTPKYADPKTFHETPVQVGTGAWAVGGTLSMPNGGGRFPAVVLVHGSGPNDRDETIGANKPFRDIAWGLATRGVAVLRYDKRTKVHGARMTGAFTVREEVIDDCLSAVALLRKTDGIDPRRVFVLGHSLGGYLAPRIAWGDSKIAGLILLAAATRPLEDHLVEQASYLAGLDGKVSDEDKGQIEAAKALAARIKDPKLPATAPARELLGSPGAYWLDLRGYDPPAVAKPLPQPMLILQGGRDYQITDTDFQAWKRHLSGRKNVQFKLYPELNHLFIAGQGKPGPQEYQQPGSVAEAVVDDVAKWIKAVGPGATARD